MLRVVLIMETEHRVVVARNWRGYYVMGIEFQFCKLRRVLETGLRDGCTGSGNVLHTTALDT